jgi:hypothetical protein
MKKLLMLLLLTSAPLLAMQQEGSGQANEEKKKEERSWKVLSVKGDEKETSEGSRIRVMVRIETSGLTPEEKTKKFEAMLAHLLKPDDNE